MSDPMLLPNVRAGLLDVPTIEQLTPTERAMHPPRLLLLYGPLRKRAYSERKESAAEISARVALRSI